MRTVEEKIRYAVRAKVSELHVAGASAHLKEDTMFWLVCIGTEDNDEVAWGWMHDPSQPAWFDLEYDAKCALARAHNPGISFLPGAREMVTRRERIQTDITETARLL